MVKYADKKVGWIIYPIMAVSFIFFANDNDLKTLVSLPSFKWDVLFSLIAISIVGIYLAYLVRFLDRNKKTSWQSAPKRRLTLQFLYGILTPLLLSIGLELIYLKWIGISFSESSILKLELPLALIYLLLINLLYYVNYISMSKQTLAEKEVVDSSSDLIITVNEGRKETLIPIESIAYIKSSEKASWLCNFEQKQFLLMGTLNEWEDKLPNTQFYRLNRQIIANKKAIKSFEMTETRRLKVNLNIAEEEAFVSKTKATHFKAWLQA